MKEKLPIVYMSILSIIAIYSSIPNPKNKNKK
jgi:hypothetical protein